MIKVTVLNENNEKITFTYESITDLNNEYWSNNIDMNVPSNDSKVIGIELVGVNDFDDLMNGNY